MSNLYIQFSSQIVSDPSNSAIAGAITYIATGIVGQPSEFYVYDYGVTNNSSATPHPIFTGDIGARSYFDSLASAALISAANSAVSAGYYTTSTIDDVAAPVYADFSSLATVASTGSYTDLANKPSITAAQVNSDWSASSGIAQISNKPSLATVATSGSYSDLSGKPTIPTVLAYDGTTQRLNAFPVFFTGTTNGSGQIIANLTVDGTSGGAALFPTGPIAKSLNFTVFSGTTFYNAVPTWSNGNKTVTLQIYAAGSASVLTSLLGALTNVLGSPTAAPSGVSVNGSVWGY